MDAYVWMARTLKGRERMYSPTAIRVPGDGIAWLTEACDQEKYGSDLAGGGLLVPTGVTFDSLETARVTGENVITWLLANGRPIGPVALDERAGRVRFLIPPRVSLPMPDVVAKVIGVGHHVRLPGPATAGDASLRWLIAPRQRRPLLTDPQDLLDGLTSCLASKDAGHDPRDLHRRSTEPSGDRLRYHP